LPLLKRTAGKPLSAAELRQRRDAARARWAAAGVAGVAGAALGAVAGGAREAVLTGAQAREAAERAGLAGLRAAYVARQQELARRGHNRQRVEDFFRGQMRQTPQPPARPTLQQAIDSLRNPQRSAAPPTRRAVRVPPIIGNVDNQLIYARQISQAQRRLTLASREVERVIRENMAAGDDREAAEAAPNTRASRQQVGSIEREIRDLERLQRLGSRAQARAGHTRTTRSGEQQEVQAAVERKYRRGESIPERRGRIRAERADTAAELARRLAEHDAKTERLAAAAERRTIRQTSEAVHQNFLTGAIRSRILHSAGRGALIGGVAGLTSAGLATLAHHVATAGRRNPANIHKIDVIDFFEPLAKFADPIDQTAIRLAQLYRRWIDRLLGRGEQALNLADGFIDALGPAITDAFTRGLTRPPVALPDDPRYRIEVDFDLINPAQRRHIAEYVLDRIVQITDDQREQIRQALMDQSVLRGIGPIEVARTIKEAIGLTAYQRGVVASFRTQLNELDPRAMQRELRDKRYDRTVARAIETNEPLGAEQVDAMVDAYHRKMLALRAQTIARTESLRATSYGGLARAQDIMDRFPELDVTKRWLATHDGRTRPTHMDLHGKEVDGMTGNFITSAGNTLRWPLDDTAPADEIINCRCTLQYIFTPKRGQLMAVAA
jgi:hypothetical protein